MTALRITHDHRDRLQRLDNGAGRALLLRYDRAHLIAVDYQRFVPADTLGEAWVTEQTLVHYRYDETRSPDRGEQRRRGTRALRL